MSESSSKANTSGPVRLASFPLRPNDVWVMFLIFLWIGATPIFVITCFTLILAPDHTIHTALMVLIVLLAVLPLPDSYATKNQLHRLGFALGDMIMKAAASYFGLEVYANSLDDLREASAKHCKEGGGGIIIPLCPHDVLPYPIFALEFFGLMTGVLFNLPYVRHLYSYCLAGDVSKKNFTRILKLGGTACFIPGGVQEVILLNDEMKENPGSKKIFLYLNKRKGFVKLALNQDSAIVPSFAFGIDGSFTFRVMPGPKELVAKIGRMIGFVPMLYFGRWGVPLGIPNPNKVTVCVGDPITHAEKVAEPSSELIEKVHKQFCDGMAKVFEDNKERCGYGDRELVIV